MAVSYRIKSKYHLDLDRYSPTSLEIKPEEIKSGKPPRIQNSFGSYGNLPSSPTFIGDIAFMRSSNRLEAYRKSDVDKYGLPTSWEESAPRMDSWNFAGKGNYSSRHNWIPQTPNVLYITGFPLGMYLHEADTKVKLRTSHEINIGAINNTGFNVSKTHNNPYSGLRNLLWDERGDYREEVLERIGHLLSKGLKPKRADAPVFGVGVTYDDKNLAEYYPQRYVVTNIEFAGKIRKLAKLYGLEDPEAVRAFMRRILTHEAIMHGLFDVDGDRVSEKKTGLWDEESYGDIAEKSDRKGRRIYEALAQSGRDYAESFSLRRAILDEITAELYPQKVTPFGRLIKKLEDEAEAFELSPKGKIEYVKMRLKHMYDDLLEEEPSPLERIVESDKTSFIIAKDGKVSYEGRRVYGEGASMPTRFIGRKGKGNEERAEEQHNGRIAKSEYKNMRDVKEREKDEQAEREAPEAETAEASVSSE